ncbi:MAG: DivIVA domain-containing protein [Cytophagales bacterium]|nr:DivIVA domain-containing protein [Cytophagales bacterium]
MKVTPLEIRQKTFEKNFRGYDKEEVEAFLLSLSQEWEKLLDKNKDLTLRLETANRELEKLHEVETTLYKTLKTAEDTGQNIMEQAEQKAALKKRESELDAERMLNEARAEATQMIEDAEIRSDQLISEVEGQARQASGSMMELLREMEFHYRELCEGRDGVLADLHRMTEDLQGRLDKAQDQKKTKQLDLEKIMEGARRVFRQNAAPQVEEALAASPQEDVKPQEEIIEEPAAEDAVLRQEEDAPIQEAGTSQEVAAEQAAEQEELAVEKNEEPVSKARQESQQDEESFFDQIN